MFPDYQLVTLIDDLRLTRSLDLTVENILEGRLSPTLPSFQQEPSPPAPLLPEESALDEDIGNKFRNDPQERQRVLVNRKLELLDGARNRFVQRQTRLGGTSNEES